MSPKQSPAFTREKIIKESFIEQELLNASVVQKELMRSLQELNGQMGVLNHTLTLIREHEFVELHKSKWRIITYQILLGILFAIGTVLGLALFSWTTYTFFKDSEILRQIVDKQLDSRNFNINGIREKAIKDASWEKNLHSTGTGVTHTGTTQSYK